jgi:hypothetical protein
VSLRIRTYTELLQYETFEERYRYLSLNGVVGRDTFGFDRYINQKFYASAQWRQLRNQIIVRDNGCDLAIPGRDIHYRLIIHHMNPMVVEDFTHGNDAILDPEFLISTTHRTHNAIHYGDENLLQKEFKPRSRGDTKLW